MRLSAAHRLSEPKKSLLRFSFEAQKCVLQQALHPVGQIVLREKSSRSILFSARSVISRTTSRLDLSNTEAGGTQSCLSDFMQNVFFVLSNKSAAACKGSSSGRDTFSMLRNRSSLPSSLSSRCFTKERVAGLESCVVSDLSDYPFRHFFAQKHLFPLAVWSRMPPNLAALFHAMESTLATHDL
jgi:hypothetical protein